MKNAVELLDVIESSHLPLSDALVERRDDILQLVDSRIQKSADPEAIAAELAGLLVDEGVVLSDQESVQEVIKEYLHVVADEEAGLGDDEKSFLEGFLK
ncbi:MAG TPA: hypothetical protein VLB90_09780 [Pseudomonadales bacterium]|nr:hypothetical protein [Pseudomonadales bacterium]